MRKYFHLRCADDLGYSGLKGRLTMEVIEFAESQGQEAAKFSLVTLEQARTRCHQFLVLLLGGAGALAGVGISQWGSNRIAALMAAAVALWWFATAAWLALRGLRSSPVRSWTYQGVTVLELEQQWTAYAAEVSKDGAAPVDVLAEVRRSALRAMETSAEQYRTASTYAARALDQAYVICALTPVPIAVAYRFGI